ncbi:unnamed protein product, partial [Scytosiphon promiscuus]
DGQQARSKIAATQKEIAGKVQRLGELQAISNQALMEGEEVPQELQEEKRGLETAIADLGRAVKALKASVAAGGQTSPTPSGPRTPLGNLPMTGGGNGGGGGGHTFVMRTTPQQKPQQSPWGSPPPSTPRDRYGGGSGSGGGSLGSSGFAGGGGSSGAPGGGSS